MARPRILLQLALYAIAIVGISGGVFASVSFLAGSLNAIPPAPKLGPQPQPDNVPLPPVIEPEPPRIDRKLTAPRYESSFATVAPPSHEAAESAVAPTSGASDSIVVLGAPAQSDAAP